MEEIVRKIGGLKTRISSEKGELTLFALVLREESIVWDLIFAAKWIDKNRQESLSYLAKLVQSVLTEDELLEISGIVLFHHEDFEEHSPKMDNDKGWAENNIDFYGVPAKKAYIFVAPIGFHIESNLK